MIGKAFFEQLIPPPLPPYTVPERHKDVLLVKTFVKFTSLLPSFLFFDKIFNIASVNNLKTSHRYGPLTIVIPVVSIIILSLFQHHHQKID